MPDKLDASYWSNRFSTKDTPWDIGHVSTPLKEYIDQLTDKNLAILIPGCGNGYEAEYLLIKGFTNITVIDIALVLTQQLEKRLHHFIGKQLTVITGDFFALQGQFDLVLEQTFFCALDPSLRQLYAGQLYQLLQPGGKLVGVLFNRSFASAAPPFGGNLNEYRQLFSPLFRIKTMTACYNSEMPRAGSECFVIAAGK